MHLYPIDGAVDRVGNEETAFSYRDADCHSNRERSRACRGVDVMRPEAATGLDEQLAIVLAGGGERVIGWQVGVLAGLCDAGLDGRAASVVLGTSAGAVAAARLSARADPRTDADRIAAVRPIAVPSQLRHAVSDALPKLTSIIWGNSAAGDETERRRQAGRFALRWRGLLSVEAHIERQAARVPDVDWPTSLRLVAIDADTGERVLLDPLSGARLAEGVAAARAVPGLVEPVPVAGRRLIDGALGSATNADLIPDGVELAMVVIQRP